jgi:ATP-dependent RNA helicase DDX18/HAS1
MPQEVAFLQFLKEANVPLLEYKFAANKVANIQDQLMKIIEKNYHLHRASRDAYRTYLHVTSFLFFSNKKNFFFFF